MTALTCRGCVRTLVDSPRAKAAARAAAGAVILIAIVLTVGAEPFVRGVAAVSVPAAAAALALGAAATLAAAWRWRIVAGRLGLRLDRAEALAAYYRSQFLNSVLVGGVLGDVHRAVWHGRRVGRIAQASRAVAAERAAGQVVQLALAGTVLVSLQLWAYAPTVGIVLLAVGAVGIGLIVAARASVRLRRAIGREAAHLRIAFGTAGTIVRVSAASAIVVGCHVATFLVACVAVGVEASPQRLVAVALIAVLAGAIPLSVGGWGPREGAAAWAFAAAGLGAAAGVAASTAFGVLALIAVAPGAAVAGVAAARRRPHPAVGEERPSR